MVVMENMGVVNRMEVNTECKVGAGRTFEKLICMCTHAHAHEIDWEA